ncbi:DUF3995 domain-containing protein [Zhouia spongiae]|uniref:DUF3995 domain-containing protein n=1 Tax=Zhouia spongiae TaxID=2202721 RepID=A0ABY3YQ31_9FLAO|nr:DUF3995 domain-containing protein [Zhouia spongiae]UNY99950.1 DUF3995 domain-containing protein [Zhouia spongiae]
MILPLFLSIIFIALGLVHYNWVIGGNFGLAVALPTDENGKRVLNPKKADSAIVGTGLIAFGVFYLIGAGVLKASLPDWIFNYGGWIIPSIFLLRAVGEFKYVGFFKKIKQTPFGKMDTKLFSPLCLFIAVAGFAIQLLN